MGKDATLTSEVPPDLGFKFQSAVRSQPEAWKVVLERIRGTRSGDFPREKPRRYVFVGEGSSAHAAFLVMMALKRDRGKPRPSVNAAASSSVGHSLIPKKGDWFFGISHRGTTESTRRALELARNRGAFTALVCSEEAAEGAMERWGVDYVIPTCPQETIEPHSVSLTSAVCALTALLGGREFDEAWVDVVERAQTLLDGGRASEFDSPSVIFGEWEGEWLAREASLKMLELRRWPTRTYRTEEYFHGPRLSLGDKDRAWWIHFGGDAREAELAGSSNIRELSLDKVTQGWSPTSARLLAPVAALLELQRWCLG